MLCINELGNPSLVMTAIVNCIRCRCFVTYYKLVFLTRQDKTAIY